MYKNGVLRYKGMNIWHVGCTDKTNQLSVISESSLQCTT